MAVSAEHRKAILAKLEEAWAASPDLRFGQLLVNALRGEPADLSQALFYIQDESLVTRVERVAKPDPLR